MQLASVEEKKRRDMELRKIQMALANMDNRLGDTLSLSAMEKMHVMKEI